MKIMSFCLLIYALLAALLVSMQVSATTMAIVLTVAGAAWALIMYLEADSVPATQVKTHTCVVPKRITNPHAWPHGFAQGFNAAVDLMQYNKERRRA